MRKGLDFIEEQEIGSECVDTAVSIDRHTEWRGFEMESLPGPGVDRRV